MTDRDLGVRKNSQCLLEEGTVVSGIFTEIVRKEKYRLKARLFLNILPQEGTDSVPLRGRPGSHCWTCSVSCTLCCCRTVFRPSEQCCKEAAGYFGVKGSGCDHSKAFPWAGEVDGVRCNVFPACNILCSLPCKYKTTFFHLKSSLLWTIRLPWK